MNDLLINEQIKFKEVRVIGTTGEQLGILSIKEARDKAIEEELDLVLVSPNANPPVCKIIDYGKHKYDLARREKEARKKQKTMDVKEIRMSPNIEENDIATKISHAKKFITKGDKVKVVLRFRGREMAHANENKYILEKFAERLADIATIDNQPKLEGRNMIMFLVPKKN